MYAETAYHVIQALPETEKVKLYAMLERDKKPIEVKPKSDGQWTDEECKEKLYALLDQQKAKRFGNKNLKVVK